jgi:HlyD family secretion protein
MTMLRRLITLLIVVAVAGAAAWAMWPRPVAVETAIIGRHDIVLTVEEEGKSRIREVFTVSAPSAGQMLRVNLHAGDEVVKGMTIVASIKPADPGLLDARSRGVAEAAVEAARAAVDLAAAEVRQAEAQLVFLKGELDRATSLIRRGTISERAFQKAQLDAETAQAVLESAKAMLMVRKRELERAGAALIETSGTGANTCCIEVRAPVSGRILRVLTESEQVVQAGTALAEIGDPTDLEIVADLLSRDAVQIKPGAAAVIDGWGGEPLSAKVVRIDPSAITKVSALGIEEQRVQAVLALDGAAATHAALGHGFRIVVRITLWKGESLLAVPIGALFRRGADWAAYTVENGVARLRVLQLGARNGEFAEVKAGFTEGETAVLHPSDKVADGVAVAVEASN